MKNNFIDDFVYPGKSIRDIPVKKKSSSSSIVLTSINAENYTDTTRNYRNYKKNISHPISKKIKRKSNNRLIFRIAYASFALSVFIITVAFFSGVFSAAHNNSKFNEYDQFIWSIVMQDPSPFDENSPPNDETVLNASIWRAASEKGSGMHNYDSKGRVLVSADEVNTSCHILFGDNVDVQLKNINSSNKFYEYIPENNTFYVDAVSYDQCFMPNTTSLTELNDLVILKVNYTTADCQPGMSSKPDKCKPEKTMEYILKKNSSNCNFYVSEIRPIK